MAVRVGVMPPVEHRARRRLFETLERAFPVQFLARQEDDWEALDAAIVFGGPSGPRQHEHPVPCLVAPSRGWSRRRGRIAVVDFTAADELDDRLRGRSMLDESVDQFPTLPSLPSYTVLARSASGPTWVLRRGEPSLSITSVPPVELQVGDRLKDHLTGGQFFALLPLVQFLREVVGATAWTRPPVRATFVLDDPNLRWKSFGYLRYEELAYHAALHRYCMGIAMIPLDAHDARGSVVRIFRTYPELSLLIHGNDHVKGEMARPSLDAKAMAIAAQAVRRMKALEARTGLSVAPIMVPPHDESSEEMLTALLLNGLEAACYTGPATDDPSLLGWLPADVHVGGGLPGLHRLPFTASADELVIRTYLDQPLILFGHHTDLFPGLGVLAEATARVNALGSVHWRPIADVARSNFLTRRTGSVLRIRPFSRRMRVEVPPGVYEVVVENTTAPAYDDVVTVAPVDAPHAVHQGLLDHPLPVPATKVAVTLERIGAVDPSTVPGPAWRPWPLVRKCLTEGRDRVLPWVRRPSTVHSGRN